MSVSDVIKLDTLSSIRVDEVSSTLLYVGEGNINAVETSPVWTIKKIEQLGPVCKISYADGNANKDNIWSDRASLIYS